MRLDRPNSILNNAYSSLCPSIERIIIRSDLEVGESIERTHGRATFQGVFANPPFSHDVQCMHSSRLTRPSGVKQHFAKTLGLPEMNSHSFSVFVLASVGAEQFSPRYLTTV